ncbi:MAG TPA: outer membrane protein assembly factor BamD, partial [Terriglobia bacterium]
MKSDHSLQLKSTTPGRSVFSFLLVLLAIAVLPACLFHPNRNQDLGSKSVAPGDQPDKVLYQKASREIDQGRYDVGRLTLQVLINTYPDSEYLSKAKLLTAESFYKQGGVSGLTQAEAEYKDFITFFPTAPEAPQAEYLAGMCHFRLMGKPDRDLTEARAAEAEFKIFLEKYPDNSMVPTVKGRLREVQEVLAQGDYDTALLYYRRGANRAAASRFQEIADSYPSFSQADQALWYLGQTQEKLHKRDDAAAAYARVLTDYPLSPEVKNAKARLVAMHEPVPKPTKATLARARADQAVAKQVHHSLTARAEGLMSSSPDLSATRHGPVVPSGHPSTLAQTKGQAPSPATANIAVEPLSDSSSPAGSPAGSPGGGATSPPANSESAVPPAPSAAPPTSGDAPSTSPAEPAASSPAPSKAEAPAETPAAPAAGSTTETAAGSDPSSSTPPSSSEKASDTAKASGSDQKSGDSDAGSSSTAKKSKFHFLKKII